MQSYGKYQLIKHIADGGMASIWLAEFVGPQGFAKELVIKRLLPELAADPTLREMFLDEARLASQLTHPNIGQISELGEIDGTHFIAMEYVDGLSLEQLLADGPLAPDLAARIMIDVLAALDHAHTAIGRDGKPLGIVHRDVTPSNILVSTDGIVKLVDFGVAKALGSASKTQSGAIKGKYAYMSPEQIQADELSRQSDVFAAGVTFYEMLTGARPFGDGIQAVSAILKDAPAPMPDTVPEPFRQIVLKALAKDLPSRYATARGMQLDLETVLRAQNSYVGQREIAILVRTTRGMEVADFSSEELDAGLFTSYRGEVQAVPAQRRLPRKRIVAVAIVVAALIAGGGLYLALRSSDTIPRGATLVLGEKTVAEADAQPHMLFEGHGIPVIIRTSPEADLYHAGARIGSTPIVTRLTPGHYKVELRRDESNKTATIDIDETDGFVTWDRPLSELKDVAEPPRAKSKARSRKTRKKPKDGFFDQIKRIIK